MRMQSHICLLVVIASASIAFAQKEEKPDAPAAATKIVVYDIRSLLRSVRDYPYQRAEAGGGGGGGGGGYFGGGGGAPPAGPQEKIDDYIKLIEITVASESWIDNGGAIGKVRAIDGLLVVTQTDDVHQQINELLSQLMRKQSRVARVRIHWLIGTPEQLQLGNAESRNSAHREIDRALLDNLPKDVIHHQAETICFSGQTVSLNSIRQHSYVSDLNPVVATDAVGFDPVITTVEDGATVQITPTIQNDGASATLDVHSTVTALTWTNSVDMSAFAGAGKPTTNPSNPANPLIPRGGESILDRPEVQLQTLDTTLRAPLGKLVIVGGMTLEPKVGGPNGAELLVAIEVFSD